MSSGLSTLYAAAARRRRERYAARPDLRKRLRRPVISVGNLAVGGRGKTPIVASISRMLLEMGERPAILSRGYSRTQPEDGVVVVRDPDGIRADLPRSGDEPVMLARQLAGVSVLVSPDRYLAGRIAERHLGATVHVLDDGFQHLQIDRDIDIVLAAAEDLSPDARTFPGGRLREPPDAIVAADAVLAVDSSLKPVEPSGEAPVHFGVRRKRGPAVTESGILSFGAVLAVAGIARPERFFDDVRAEGYDVAGTLGFRDHHPYSKRDVERILSEAEEFDASAVLTTEKDYVRLLPFRPFPLPVAYLPLTMEPDPLPEFRRWLADSLRAARDIV
ncbi:MAG TPA: tetraacyldisaccharide 4'-kinase [Vicinamibacterales bacterium]|jgi:tetraacyldisaccharide 4'-kinase|nr:tetraacyldisaccharide 4'-kinase [Vicinamibacterales bacterium]